MQDAEVHTNFSNLAAVNTLQLEDRIKIYNNTSYNNGTIEEHENFLKEKNIQSAQKYDESKNSSSFVDVSKFDAKDLMKERASNIIEILTDQFETGTKNNSNNCARSNDINIPMTSDRLIQPEIQGNNN